MVTECHDEPALLQLFRTALGHRGYRVITASDAAVAMQQLDVEQRHALRLLLIYQDPADSQLIKELANIYLKRGDTKRALSKLPAGRFPTVLDFTAALSSGFGTSAARRSSTSIAVRPTAPSQRWIPGPRSSQPKLGGLTGSCDMSTGGR